MIARIKAAVVRFASRPKVRSTARHASTAAVAVIVTAISIGGIHAITTGVCIVALGAAARVVELATIGKVIDIRKARKANAAAVLQAAVAAAVAAADAGAGNPPVA